MQDNHYVLIEEEKIVFVWTEEEVTDDTRYGAMYCFKSCSVNQN